MLNRTFFLQSFAEKIAGLMARPNQDAIPRDDVPWYLKYAGRGLGIVGAFCKWKLCCFSFSIRTGQRPPPALHDTSMDSWSRGCDSGGSAMAFATASLKRSIFHGVGEVLGPPTILSWAAYLALAVSSVSGRLLGGDSASRADRSDYDSGAR